MRVRRTPPTHGAPPRSPRAGVILVFVICVITLCALLAMTLLRMVRISGAGSTALLKQTRTRMAALSGMEYAAARLMAQGRPSRPFSAEARGDDWTFRQGASARLEGAANPSYAHGEAWTDTDARGADNVDNDGDGTVDEGGEKDGLDNDGDGEIDEGDETDGAWQPEEAYGPDLDGDGRFSAWTGRLRGEGDPCSLRFSLKVESPEGKLPVNAGSLGPDRYGVPMVTDQDSGEPIGDMANGVPDHCDLALPYHRSLAHALNNLGVLCNLFTRREDKIAANPSEPIRICWLGDELIGNRPLGGYRSMEDLRRTLVDVLGYASWEYEAVAPYLDLGPYDTLGECARGSGYESEVGDYPRYVPVNLCCASQTVLESLLRYVSCTMDTGSGAGLFPLPGELFPVNAWGKLNTRTNLPFMSVGDLASEHLTFLLYPDEAHAIAGRIVSGRSSGLSWESLHESLMASSPLLFRQDANDLNQGTACPEAARSWTQAKACVAYQALAADPYPFDVSVGPAGWATGWQKQYGDPPRPVLSFARLRTVLYPDGGFGDPSPWGSEGPQAPYVKKGFRIRAQGGTLAPPVSFTVSSLGFSSAGATVSREVGRFKAADRLELTSQEDFENLTGGPILSRRGIRSRNDLPAPFYPRPLELDATVTPNRTYPALVSLPRWNRRSLTGAAGGPPHYGFSRQYGALGLAPREIGLRTAALYLPLQEQYDQAKDTDRTTEGPAPSPLICPVFQNNGVDFSRETPYGTSLSETQNFNLQDLSGPGGPFRNKHAVEFWGRPDSEFGWHKGDQSLILSMQPFMGGIQPQILFELTPSWGPSLNWTTNQSYAPLSHGHHVVLTWDASGPQTSFTLYLDGNSLGPGNAATAPPPSLGSMEKIGFKNIDELRLYNQEASEGGDVDPNYQLGRYVRKGEYSSPLYVLDEPADLLVAQWTGNIPLSLRDSAGKTVDPFTVEVDGYANADGTGLVGTVLLGDGDPFTIYDARSPYSLGGGGKCRSFRYRVGFDCSGVERLVDTPIFDSIWIAFRRPGRTGWTSWGRR